jgi:hypothetical protein
VPTPTRTAAPLIASSPVRAHLITERQSCDAALFVDLRDVSGDPPVAERVEAVPLVDPGTAGSRQAMVSVISSSVGCSRLRSRPNETQPGIPHMVLSRPYSRCCWYANSIRSR